MKKLLSVAVALALVLSLGASAFAQAIVFDSQGQHTYDDYEVKYEGDAQRIEVNGSHNLTVTGNLTETGNQHAVDARNFEGDVEIKGNVSKSGEGDAIHAEDSGEVEVEGNVSKNGEGFAVYAESGSKVEVEGNVTEAGTGIAVYASDKSEVEIEGNVTQSGSGFAVSAGDGSKVYIGGNADAGDGDAAVLVSDATVVVEGKAIGLVTVADDTSEVYLGELDGEIGGLGDFFSRVYYLIGFTDDDVLENIGYEHDGIIQEGNIEAAKKNYYFFTNTSDPAALSGKTVTLKPNDSNKILSVSGFDSADVKYVANEDGTVSFIIGSAFKGGMQNLKLVLSERHLYVITDTVTVVSIEIPEGIDKDLIKKYNSMDHAGLVIDGSLLDEGDEHSIKVLLEGEELPEDAYYVIINEDGSVSIVLSNTYMIALGDGTYDCVLIIDGLEIPFTVEVDDYDPYIIDFDDDDDDDDDD